MIWPFWWKFLESGSGRQWWDFVPKFKSKEEFLVSVIDLARTRRGENFRGLYFALEGQ